MPVWNDDGKLIARKFLPDETAKLLNVPVDIRNTDVACVISDGKVVEHLGPQVIPDISRFGRNGQSLFIVDSKPYFTYVAVSSHTKDNFPIRIIGSFKISVKDINSSMKILHDKRFITKKEVMALLEQHTKKFVEPMAFGMNIKELAELPDMTSGVEQAILNSLRPFISSYGFDITDVSFRLDVDAYNKMKAERVGYAVEKSRSDFEAEKLKDSITRKHSLEMEAIKAEGDKVKTVVMTDEEINNLRFLGDLQRKSQSFEQEHKQGVMAKSSELDFRKSEQEMEMDKKEHEMEIAQKMFREIQQKKAEREEAKRHERERLITKYQDMLKDMIDKGYPPEVAMKLLDNMNEFQKLSISNKDDDGPSNNSGGINISGAVVMGSNISMTNAGRPAVPTCPSCGKVASAGTKFCPECGTRI